MGGRIPVKFFAASIIETDLDNAAPALRIAEGQVGQPVMYIQPVTSPAAASTITFTARGFPIGRTTITASHIQKD